MYGFGLYFGNDIAVDPMLTLFANLSSLTDVNQRSTPEGAKVNGSQNCAEQRYFAMLSMTGSAGSTPILLPMFLQTYTILREN